MNVVVENCDSGPFGRLSSSLRRSAVCIGLELIPYAVQQYRHELARILTLMAVDEDHV